MNDVDARAEFIDRLAEEFLARYRRGEHPALQEYTEKHPDYAAQIRDLFPALVILEQAAPASDSETVSPDSASAVVAAAGLPEELGGYRIVREIGRGGMGVVYEAEQKSLGRRVALKVLLGNAAQDAKVLARFQRESRAAAQLHHTNIVPVYEVGQQDGLCYYAMQFIRGQALDEVFRELQHFRAASVHGAAKEAPADPLAQSLWTGVFEPTASADGTLQPEPVLAPQGAGTRPAELSAALPDRSELSSVMSNYKRFCRNITRLGLQTAEALAYAHSRGIIHRDIKPANLLLDSTGVLWVSDFGLAKTQDPALTESGDLLGTLRYMAPERFRGECDARADVYALGLTLYELLVLRPAFDATDRLHLVKQIGRQEPVRPRLLEPRIPRDLETIIMKAIEKDPRRRYPSAEAMAADLRRFLADEPIQARRTGPLERLGRWGRRNPLVAGLSAAIVLVAALGFVGVVGQWQVAVAHEQQANANAVQAQQNEQEANQPRDEVKALNDQLRRTLYAAHMNLAKHAWDAGGHEQVRELLEQHRPKPGENDLRGFEWFYLSRQSLLLSLKGHTHPVSSVAYSLDGKRLASVGGGELKVWDAQTGKELLARRVPGHYIIRLAFSPDGKRLAGAPGAGGALKVWDAQTGQELFSLESGVNCVAFSPDGKRLVSGSPFRRGDVGIWDAQAGQELPAFKGHTSTVMSVAFSPDGKLLASGSKDKTVKLWDAQTGQELRTLQGHTSRLINSVAFSPDGKRLASGAARDESDTGEGLKVWDAETGQELLTIKSDVSHVVFSPDGKHLVSTDQQTMKLWDAQTGLEVLAPMNIGSNVVFSPDGKHLASTGRAIVRVWDVQYLLKPMVLKGGAKSIASVVFSPDGKRLASAGQDPSIKFGGMVEVWDAQTGQELFTFKRQTGGERGVAFSPDGKRLASASSDNTMKVWDAQTGQELLTLKGGATWLVLSEAFSPDGKRLASASADQTLKVWDAQTGQQSLTLKGHTGPVFSVVFSPDGKRLVSASADQTLKVWDAQTGQELLTLKGHSGIVWSVVFSPDGKRLASASADQTLKLWDAQTGQELLTLKGHSGEVTTVAYSPDGKRLASTSSDKTVKLWDAQTGEELLTIKGLSGVFNGVAFSPDGQRLAAGAADGTVKIWDATPQPEER